SMGIEEEIAARKMAAEAAGQKADDYVTQEYLEELHAEMLQAAANLEFERAAQLRDRIAHLKGHPTAAPHPHNPPPPHPHRGPSVVLTCPLCRRARGPPASRGKCAVGSPRLRRGPSPGSARNRTPSSRPGGRGQRYRPGSRRRRRHTTHRRCRACHKAPVGS